MYGSLSLWEYECMGVCIGICVYGSTVCVYCDAELVCLFIRLGLDWLPLPCIALIQPSQLSCLGSSVGRASA